MWTIPSELGDTHSPARGLYELHMGWGLLLVLEYNVCIEPLVHTQHGAIVTVVESLIKSHIE